MLRLFSLIVFFVSLIIIVLYVTLSAKGEQMFADAIHDATGRQTTVRDAGIIFPFTLRLDGLKIEGLLEATETLVELNMSELIKGQLKFSHVKLLYPIVYIEKSSQGHILFGQKIFRSTGENIDHDYAGASIRENTIYQDEDSEQFDITGLDETDAIPEAPRIIQKLVIEDGRFVLKDNSSATKKVWIIDEVFLTANNVPLNFYPIKSKIDMRASLRNTKLPFVGHNAFFKGWVNWAHKNMDAVLTIQDDRGGVGLDAYLISKENNMEVAGKVKLKGGSSNNSGNSLEDAVMGALFAADASLDANFSFQTRMDRIQLSNISFGGNFSSGLDEKSSDELVSTLQEVKESFDQLSQEGSANQEAMINDADTHTGTVSATVD